MLVKESYLQLVLERAAVDTFESLQVIDLTERKGDEQSEMAKQQRDREQFLQQQRDLMMRHTLQVSEGELPLFLWLLVIFYL